MYIRLNQRKTAYVSPEGVVEVHTKQVIGGGGDKNCKEWAEKVIDLGYTKMILWVTIPDSDTKTSINVVNKLQYRVDTINRRFPEFHMELKQGDPEYLINL